MTPNLAPVFPPSDINTSSPCVCVEAPSVEDLYVSVCLSWSSCPPDSSPSSSSVRPSSSSSSIPSPCVLDRLGRRGTCPPSSHHMTLDFCNKFNHYNLEVKNTIWSFSERFFFLSPSTRPRLLPETQSDTRELPPCFFWDLWVDFKKRKNFRTTQDFFFGDALHNSVLLQGSTKLSQLTSILMSRSSLEIDLNFETSVKVVTTSPSLASFSPFKKGI
jgi:hypothetical protein